MLQTTPTSRCIGRTTLKISCAVPTRTSHLAGPTRTNLDATLLVYPGITDAGRWRGNFRTQLRWELIEYLFWNLTYYYTFDNEPSPEAASNDTGINTSIGYSF